MQTLCSVCNRVTVHFLENSCTDHSDYPPKVKPRAINVVIPAFKPEEPAPKAVKMPKLERVKAGVEFQDDELLSALLELPVGPKVVRSDKLVCSFCGDQVHPLRATRGMAKPRKVDGGLLKTHDQFGKMIDFEPIIHHVPDPKVACPKCVLLITPIFKRCATCKGKDAVTISKCPDCKGTKEGEMMHNGVEFPQSEG